MNNIKLAVLPGDGIGRDVMFAAIPIFEKLNLPIEIRYGDIGWNYWINEGNSIPDRTWKLINDSDVVLLGATTSMPEREALEALPNHLKTLSPNYVSPIVQLRQKLDLYVNIRPCFNIKGETEDFNFCIIRENTEGLYAGLDFSPLPKKLLEVINENPRWAKVKSDDASCSLRLQTHKGLIRLFEFAFNYADRKKFRRVTFADKPNVLRKSGSFAREIFENIAKKYSHIESDIHNIDAVALWMVKRPQEFGVIVAENMFGDILSDLGAGLMGGLGFAPSANIGINNNYFEPVHGSAPRIKSNTANPTAMFLTISMLLGYIGFYKESNLIINSIKEVLKTRSCGTYDLGGKASTDEMANEIIKYCLKPNSSKIVSLLATGNELVEGEILDTNSNFFAKALTNKGGNIYQHIQVSDKKIEIIDALKYLLNYSDAVIVCGGLGPTSDDNTRFAISELLNKELYFDQNAWQHITERLKNFNLKITEPNKQQALFPIGAKLYPNENGTAFGFMVEFNNKQIFILPGPPKEAIFLFKKFVMPALKDLKFLQRKRKIYRWLTLGLIEGEIAPEIDNITKLYNNIETSFRWNYPYLEIKIGIEKNVNIDLIDRIDTLLKSFTVSRENKGTYETLENILKDFDKEICIFDKISEGEFISQVVSKSKLHYFSDFPINKNFIFVTNSPVTSKKALYASKEIILEVNGFINGCYKYGHQISIPNRGEEVKDYINSYFAWQLFKFIRLIKENTYGHN